MLGSNLLTGYVASRFNDNNWERYIEQVAGPTYRNAGFEEGYYKSSFDACLELLGQNFHYECLGLTIRQYEEKRHLRYWDWQRAKGKEYH